LFFCFQRPDIGRRLANMPVESYVAVRGWVYPRPPGQRNVVNIIRIVHDFYAVLDVVREIIAVHITSKQLCSWQLFLLLELFLFFLFTTVQCF